jgi:hypothetical protein
VGCRRRPRSFAGDAAAIGNAVEKRVAAAVKEHNAATEKLAESGTTSQADAVALGSTVLSQWERQQQAAARLRSLRVLRPHCMSAGLGVAEPTVRPVTIPAAFYARWSQPHCTVR